VPRSPDLLNGRQPRGARAAETQGHDHYQYPCVSHSSPLSQILLALPVYSNGWIRTMYPLWSPYQNCYRIGRIIDPSPQSSENGSGNMYSIHRSVLGLNRTIRPPRCAPAHISPFLSGLAHRMLQTAWAIPILDLMGFPLEFCDSPPLPPFQPFPPDQFHHVTRPHDRIRFPLPRFRQYEGPPNDAIKIRLPGVPRRRIPRPRSRRSRKCFVTSLEGFSGWAAPRPWIKLTQITTIAGSPHEPIGSKSLVTAGSCPTCDLPRRRIQHSKFVGPRLGENNFAVLGYCQPVLTGVFSRRHRDRITPSLLPCGDRAFQ